MFPRYFVLCGRSLVALARSTQLSLKPPMSTRDQSNPRQILLLLRCNSFLFQLRCRWKKISRHCRRALLSRAGEVPVEDGDPRRLLGSEKKKQRKIIKKKRGEGNALPILAML